MADTRAPDGALYVSCVDGKPVTRFALGVGLAHTLGAERGEGGKLVFDPELVIKLSADEVEAHGREYRRALVDGGLKVRTAAEWEAQQKKHGEAEKKARDEAAKAAKESAKADATPGAPAGDTVR